MRRLLLIIAGILIFTAVAVPSAAVYYFAFTEEGLQYLFSKIPHKAGNTGLEFLGVRGTIAHGYLTLSLLGPISQELIDVTDATTSLNYGLNKVRFPAPLPVDAEFRGHGQILEATPFPGGVQVSATFTVEVNGAPKPALVAECLFRYYR